jgi:hypothetical protein
MTLTALTETEQLREFGAGYARAGHAKPDFAAWSVTYGAGTPGIQAHRAFCRGFDGVRNDAWESTKRNLTRVPLPARRERVAVPA